MAEHARAEPGVKARSRGLSSGLPQPPSRGVHQQEAGIRNLGIILAEDVQRFVHSKLKAPLTEITEDKC